ncbi:MAG: hypothetical protein ACK4V2_06555 [Pseudomonadota bacterium]|jgi:type VI protein secretion system component Hcp|nr:hypothetical protein [Alphaproteobacteria bacterium]
MSISELDKNKIIISDPSARDGSQSSSADLYAKIVYSGNPITSSQVTGYEQWAVISGLKMNVWRHESGDVSNSATNSSASLGMDEIEFTLPASDVDITAIETIANGQAVNITFRKTGNISQHSVPIEEFDFQNAQIVSTFFLAQTAAAPSVTIRFKAKQMQITRFAYKEGQAAGQKVYLIDFVKNTSK